MELTYQFNRSSKQVNLIILYISVFFIFSYNNILMTITPIFIMDLGGDTFLAGLQSTLFLIVAVGLRLIFGPLADTKGNKTTLLIGGGAFLFSSILFIICEEIWQILILRLIQALGLAAYFPSASSTVISYAPEGKAGKYIGIYRLITTSTLLFGPLITLNLITEKGYYTYNIVMAIIACIGLFTLLPLKIPSKNNLIKDQKHKFFTISTLKNTMPMYISTFIIAVCYGLLFNFTIIFVNSYSSIENPGHFFTLFGFGGLISSIVLGMLSDRFGRLHSLVITFIILGISMACFRFIPTKPFFFYFAGLLAGIGYSGGIVILMAWTSEVVQEKIRTSALSMQQNWIDIGIAFGASFFGIIFRKISYAPIIYTFVSLFILTFTVMLFLFYKNKHHFPSSIQH